MSLEYFLDVLMDDVSPFLTKGGFPLVQAVSYVLQTGGAPLDAGKPTEMSLVDDGSLEPVVPYWPIDWKLAPPGIPAPSVVVTWPDDPAGMLVVEIQGGAGLLHLLLEPGWPPPTQIGGYSLWRPDVVQQGPWPEVQRFLFVPECDPVLGCVKGDLYIIAEREGVAYPPMGPVAPFLHHLLPLNELVPWPPPLFGEQGGGIWRTGWVTGGNHVLPSASHVFRLPPGALAPNKQIPITAPGKGVVFEVGYSVNFRHKPAKTGTVVAKYLDFSLRLGVGPHNYLTVIHLHKLAGRLKLAMGYDYPNMAALPVGTTNTVLVNVSLDRGDLLGWYGGRALQEAVIPLLRCTPDVSVRCIDSVQFA